MAQLTAWKLKPLPGIRMRDGNMATTEQEWREMWTLHWKEVYHAQEFEVADTSKASMFAISLPEGANAESPFENISLADVLRAITAMRRDKASPDI
eukprot:1950613-Amphidinium_carterae.1